MPRELGDVLHYFIPEIEETEGAPDGGVAPLAVPLLGRDLVRAALLWNLAVEAARQGARATLVTPIGADEAPWPSGTPQPLGVEVLGVAGDEPAGLARAAESATRHASRGARRLVMAGVPAPWLAKGADAEALLRWVVALVRPDEREGDETWSVLEAVGTQSPHAQLGAVIFGVRSLGEARRAFERLAARVERELARTLISYGVLIDDVELSRSIVTRRPISLVHPASAAARALADVAALCLADAVAGSSCGLSPARADLPATARDLHLG